MVKTLKRVVVAMSGGLDSSVTAALLREQGFEVTGVTMDLLAGESDTAGFPSRGGREAIASARQVAEKLGIRHGVLSLRQDFERGVVQDFISEYRRGRTPNPCVRCNQVIKFGRLWQWAQEREADFLATGHYSRVYFNQETGKHQLLKGIDSGKDQSYFLWPLTQEVLPRVLMPLGGMKKREVGKLANKYRLPLGDRRESQEICFVPDGDYPGFIRTRSPESFRPGPIRDLAGRELGEHEGLPTYTIGQRKRLRLKTTEVFYVVRIDPEENALVVGKGGDLSRKFIEVEGVNWIAGNGIPRVFVGQVKIRSQHTPAEAVIRTNPGGAEVEFLEKQKAVSPGQSAVFYRGEEVVGGGLIK